MKRRTKHDFYEKTLDNGKLSVVKISHGNGEIPPPVWMKMLKYDLKVTQDYFNSVI
jgi:hypothetical protein